MVKLKGPAISHATHGSLADVLQFAKGKKTAYAKKHAAPKQPRTSKQLTVRAMTSFLAKQWSTLSSAEKETWNARAALTQIGAYHAYISANSKRWSNLRGPTKQDPATESSTPPKLPGFLPAPRIKSCLVGVEWESPVPTWGYIVYRDTTNFTGPRQDLAVALFPKLFVAPGYTYWLDTPLETGTYYYTVSAFNDDGVIIHRGNTKSAVIA